MKKLIGIVLLSMLPVIGISADVNGAENVHEVIDRWVKMWNTYDLGEVNALFCNCDDLSYFSSEKEGLIRGFDAVLEHHRGFGFKPGESVRETRLWLEDIGILDIGSAYLVTAIWHFERPDRVQKGPVTIVLQQGSGLAQEIVHMNFSNY